MAANAALFKNVSTTALTIVQDAQTQAITSKYLDIDDIALGLSVRKILSILEIQKQLKYVGRLAAVLGGVADVSGLIEPSAVAGKIQDNAAGKALLGPKRYNLDKYIELYNGLLT